MVLSLPEMISKYGLAPAGVIHVGAHFGQEYDRYKEAGLKDIIFIEPCTPAFRQLQKNMEGKSDVKLFKLACSEQQGTAMMNVEAKNEGMSNSLRRPKKHLEQYPDILFDYNEQVNTDRLDNLMFDREKYNMLYMDVQGCEDMVLKGAPNTLKYIDIVYTEVNRAELYEGNVMVEQLNELLKDFEQVHVNWTGDTWGDAVYKRVKPAVWLSEPMNFTIELPQTNKEKSVCLFDAINTAFQNPKDKEGKPVIFYSSLTSVFYHELLRMILAGHSIKVVAIKVSTDKEINTDLKVGTIIRSLDKEPVYGTPVLSLSDDKKSLSAAVDITIDALAKIYFENVNICTKYLIQIFPEVKRKK